MKKRNKNIDIPTGSDNNSGPVMRKSSTKKLGRGFSDIMGTSYQKPSGRIQNTTSAPSSVPSSAPVSTPASVPSSAPASVPSSAPASVPSSAPVSTPASVPSSVPASTSASMPSQDTFQNNNAASKTSQLPKVPAEGQPYTPPSYQNTQTMESVSKIAQQLSGQPALEPDGFVPEVVENPVMDQAGIESVMTGTPKSSSKMGTVSERREQRKKHKVKRTLIVLLVITLIVSAVAGIIYLFSSDNFKIEKIEINGALHLTNDEVLMLANIPEDETLLRVDADTIAQRLKRDAWIKDVGVARNFPDTLTINITERTIAAIVEVPTTKESGSSVSTSTSATSKNTSVRMWAISADRIWLMPIPDQNSEIGKSINQQIYNDVAGILHIVDVLPSVSPEIGCYCTDATLQCAIDVVSSMTTELRSQVKYAKASDSQSTTLILNNGVEVAFGTSENTREKERIVLELLEKYEGKISFINVRNVNNPTWRML